MTVQAALVVTCDDPACAIGAAVYPIGSLTMPADLDANDKLVPIIHDGFNGWAVRDGKHYCPWCKDKEGR